MAQDFKIDKDKWKMLSDNSDSVNMALLRQQQQRLAIIKAVKVFFEHQNTLRTILRQPVSSLHKTTALALDQTSTTLNYVAVQPTLKEVAKYLSTLLT